MYLSLILVNYNFLRKIKPIQNLSLIIASALWVIILPLLLFENETMARIAGYFVVFSIIPISLFLVLSIPFLFFNKTGTALLEDDKLVIDEKSYDLKKVRLKLNIDQSEWVNTSRSIAQKIKSLPKWGNYLILNTGKELEFKPTKQLEKFLDSIKISGHEKRSVLMVKTTDLFSNLVSMLWAAS